jgi:hypothetical protein
MVSESSPSTALFHSDGLLAKVIAVQVFDIVDDITCDSRCTCTNGSFCLNFILNKFRIQCICRHNCIFEF